MIEAAGTPIVGRSEPLGVIGHALRLAREGSGASVFVSGTAGIGKTSVIRHGIDSASDFAVGWGTCWHDEGAPGFWPWMQAFDSVVRSTGPKVAASAAGRDRPTLATLVRALAEADPGDVSGVDRLILFDATRRWLDELGSHQPLVVVLDDLQWADSSTLDLLEFLLASPSRARLLILGSFRDDDPNRSTQDRLASLAARTSHFRLEGLSPDEVETLAAGECGPEQAAALAPELHRRTGGHPLFVRELARLSKSGSSQRLPGAVRGAVSLRLDSLPGSTREVLDAACVLGNEVLVEVLAPVVGMAVDGVSDAMDPAVDAGIVLRESTGRLRFSHDVFRETVAELLSASARTSLHSRIAVALADAWSRGAVSSPGDIAGHFAAAIPLVDPKDAVEWARRAASDDRSRSAFTEAAGHLRRVREAVVAAGLDAPVVELLIEEADLVARSGSPDRARTLLADADRVASNPAQRADVALAVQSLGAKFANRRDDIIGQLRSALDQIRGSDTPREARLTAALARELQHSVEEDRTEVKQLSERALELGRNADDDRTLIACLLARHDALWEPGTGAERVPLGREIAAAGTRVGSTDHIAEGTLLEANGLLESGSAAFRPVLGRWFDILEARDEPRDRYMVLTRRAALALIDGLADEAEDFMRRAVEMGELVREPDTANVWMSQRVALAGIREDPSELRELATDAVDHWRGAPVLAHSVAAGALALAGDLDGCAAEVETVAALGGIDREHSYLRSVLVTHLADAAIALEDTDLCRSLYGHVSVLSHGCGVNGAVVAFAGPFAHTAGVLAAALGETDTSIELLGTSVAIAHRLGARVWIRRSEAALNRIQPSPWEARSSASMLRSGNVWTLQWREAQCALPASKGLEDLSILLANPGEEISAATLMAGGRTHDPGAVEVIDRAALLAYRNRLAELDEELNVAGGRSDIAVVEKLEAERDLLLDEIGSATGIGGRIRRDAGDPGERARKAVSARIRDAIKRVGQAHPALGDHLDRCISTGSRCSYNPVPGEAVRWRVGSGP